MSSHDDPDDRRARLVALTSRGADKLAEATPRWEAAQRELRATVGEETTLALNGLLDLAGRKLKR